MNENQREELKKRVRPKYDDESGKMLNKAAVIKRESDRMKLLVEIMAPEQLVIAEPVIESVAFQTANLQELESILNVKGFTEEYMNGANQFGLKESSESKAYFNLARTCLAFRKQLFEITSRGASKADADALASFLGF